MRFVGRSRELGALRQLLDRREPQLVRVVGLPGVGKSALVRRAAADYAGLAFVCAPGPDPFVRAELRRRLDAAAGSAAGNPEVTGSSRGSPPDVERDAAAGARGGAASDAGSTGRVGGSAARPGVGTADADDWPALLSSVLEAARSAERPWVLVLDDAHRLADARARFLAPLLDTLAAAAGDEVPLHVVLVGREAGLPEVEEAGTRRGGATAVGDAAAPAVTTLRLAPLPFRAAAELLPGTEADARLRAYGVFGGIPRVLSRLDRDLTVGTNVRRLLLDPDGALADAPLSWLEREVQTPARYVAVLRALASGPVGWGAIHEGVPDLTRSGQVAPYLARLQALGMVSSSSSLDAGRRSRATRYELTDPFLAFWLRFVLPWRSSEEAYAADPPLREHYATRIRPAIDGHMGAVLPAVARRHLELDALASLGVAAREAGALWGPGYDIPVAGMLTSGAACYGACSWKAPPRDASPLERLDAQIRETRYGFGRELRLRLVFTGRPPPTWLLREAARRADAEVIDAEALAG